MNLFLVVFGLASFWYIRHNNIHFAPGDEPYIYLWPLYTLTCTGDLVLWIHVTVYIPLEDDRLECMKRNFMGRLSHIFGFIILILLLRSISSIFALCFGLPFSLWFLMAFLHSLCIFCANVDEEQLQRIYAS